MGRAPRVAVAVAIAVVAAVVTALICGLNGVLVHRTLCGRAVRRPSLRGT